MKAKKLLPLLLVAPLLASCGGSKKVNPKFAKEGDKVELAAFNTAMNDAAKEGEFVLKSEEGYKLPSLVWTTESQSSSDESVTRGKKAISENNSYSESKYEGQYDSQNALYARSGKSSSTASQKTTSGLNVSQTTSGKVKTMRQAQSVDGKDYMVLANEVSKEYSKVTELSESVTASSYLQSYIKGQFSWAEMGIALLAAVAETEQYAPYTSLYQNGKAFTVVYDKLEENVETKDIEEKVVYTTTTHTYYKYQLDYSKADVVKCVSYEEVEKTVTYAQDEDEYAKGDVYKKVTKSYSVDVATKKEVSLKAVDLASFTKLGKTW